MKQFKPWFGAKAGWTYLRSAAEGFSDLGYSKALENERAVTSIIFLSRARPFLASHGSERIHLVTTDNGAHYKTWESLVPIPPLPAGTSAFCHTHHATTAT